MGPIRAAVLILVHLIIAAHIIQWAITGMTLSPVEPSEAMYTLERGKVNAGFVVFILAIASTLLFGRFFCGWLCHVVALQDLCAWAMKKLGVRPRPLRARLLLLAPLILALYMFVWPTLKRELIRPAADALGLWESLRPWLGEAPPPVFRSAASIDEFFEPAFFVRDFWATFPEWYIAIPFLLICGFACVYFLGAKGFCTYGCPYGGFFAPVDRYSIGRIVVSDACEHCGHCTSVCTSNVRVHEEVRDFGMVVDPGCMKCMDCVSVCPNHALSFAFARPAALTKPRVTGLVQRFRSRVYDWSPKEEWAYAAIFFLMVMGYRGMFDSIPLLMAMGMGACAVYLVWKAHQTLTLQSVRAQSLQLRLKGKTTHWGRVTIAAAALCFLAGAWGAALSVIGYLGEATLRSIALSPAQVFAPGYAPTDADRQRARRAQALLTLTAHPQFGGIGYRRTEGFLSDLAWTSAVLGDRDAAVRFYDAALHRGAASRIDVSHNTLNALAVAMASTRATPDDIAAAYRRAIDAHPNTARTRIVLAQGLLRMGKPDQARILADQAADTNPHDPEVMMGVAGILASLGDLPATQAVLERIVREYPRVAQAHRTLALIHLGRGETTKALTEAQEAVRIAPRDPLNLRTLLQVQRAADLPEAAADTQRRLDALQPPAAAQPATPTPTPRP